MATLLGAGISTVTAFIVLSLGQRADRKKREEERKRSEARRALSGYLKLTEWANLLVNIKQHIDKFYDEANSNGLMPHEPWEVVWPSTGKFSEPEHTSPTEYSFLVYAKRSDLIVDLALVESRAKNCNHLLDEYSRLWLEKDRWLESLPEFEREKDGLKIQDSFPVKYKAQWELRVGNLNTIIGNLIEHMENDIDLACRVVNEYAEIAHEVFQEDFPKIKFHLEGKLKN